MWVRKRTINTAMLAKIIGWLLMIEGAFMLVPALAALCYGENDSMALAGCSLGTIIFGYLLNHTLHPAHKTLGKRDGLLLTASVWVVFSIFGMMPFLLSEHPLGVVDAFFESMAGFTTTGCSAYASPENLGNGLNLWRAMMQWIGGMGIILFTLAVIPVLNHSGGMQMFNAEVTGITHDKTRPRISSTAKSLWGVYLCLTVACFTMLWAGPMDFFDSVCHAFGIMSTGGFSTRNMGVMSWDSTYLTLIVTIFMFLGGTNFSMIFFACQGKFKPLKQNAALRVYIMLIIVSTAIITLSLIFNGTDHTWIDATVHSLFQVVASLTSTGYVVPGLSSWGSTAAAVLVPLIFFGACAGSTSGGAKIDRMVVMAKYARNAVRQALQPNQVTQVVINHKVMPSFLVNKAVSFICLFMIVIVVGALLLSMLGMPMADSFFTAMSAMANAGIGGPDLGLGIGYAEIHPLGKLTLCALMLIGRLEVFTILLIFTPDFWRS